MAEISVPTYHAWKFTNEFLAALDACDYVEYVHVLPRVASPYLPGGGAEVMVSDREAVRIPLARLLLAYAWRGIRANLVICRHLRLLPQAWVYARLVNSQLALLVDGSEASAPRPSMLANRLTRSIDSFVATSAEATGRFGRWSGIPMDRGFLLPDVSSSLAANKATVEEFRAAVGDWLWGCVSIERVTEREL